MNSLTTFRRVVTTHHRLFLPALSQQQQQQHAWMSSSTTKKPSSRKKSIKGNRGARGHGWYVKYRSGRGGRSLQGEYWDRNDHHWDPEQWNDAVLSLGSQYVYLDIAVEPPSTNTGSAENHVENDDEEEEIVITKEEGEGDNEWASSSNNEENTATTTTSQSQDNNKNDDKEEESTTVERLVIRVASTVMPETCINFIGLVQDAKYNDSVLYRIEKEVGICGGDVLTNTGKTGQCWQSFPDYANIPPRPRATTMRRDLPPPSEEPMALWHTAGMVTMLCPKVNEIDSRFLLCGKDAPHLDGIHRAFGKLEPESLEIVQKWQSSIITAYGKPKSATLRIVDCGVLENYSGSNSSSDSSAKGDEKVEASSSA